VVGFTAYGLNERGNRLESVVVLVAAAVLFSAAAIIGRDRADAV
jgi:hypothetical protein